MNSPGAHDQIERISAYIDGELSPAELGDLEMRLQSDDSIQKLYQQILLTHTILHNAPHPRAPRNFTLSSQQVQAHRKPTAFLTTLFALRTMQVSALVSSLLFILVLLGDYLTTQLSSAPMPAYAPMVQQESAPGAAALPMQTTLPIHTGAPLIMKDMTSEGTSTSVQTAPALPLAPLPMEESAEEDAPRSKKEATEPEADEFLLPSISSPTDSMLGTPTPLPTDKIAKLPLEKNLASQPEPMPAGKPSLKQEAPWLWRLGEIAFLALAMLTWVCVWLIARRRKSV